MSKPRCLVIDSMHESLFGMMHEIGWEVDYRPEITRDEVKKVHQGFDGLIVRSKTVINADLLGENPTVKVIGRAGAGLDNVDLAYMQSKNITVIHASEGNRDAVGEFTLGALLSLLRNLPRADREVRQQIWDREGNRGEEIMNKTVSIIGYGNMGQAFARRLSGFGCNVLAYDKYKDNYSDLYAREADYETIYRETDILSLHIPITGETSYLVNTAFLNRFHKDIILINTARGEIVSLNDINDALNRKKVRGAVLDVLENEKLNTLTNVQRSAFDSLKEKSNVILTPHIAGWTFESHIKINVALVSKLKRLG
jgi:D-3-phosphoglycerate dehydrogenase / 2-oxoglutarate reductase